MESQVSPIEDILFDYGSGKMVILVDDEQRENEGDLVISAAQVSADDINFMASHGRGLICLTLTEERCRLLNLPLMVSHNNARYSTNFTVSIDAATDITTGISASDRAKTIRKAVEEDAQAEDIVTPGHIFPVMAQPGGVLTRAGHTEAGVDLARICGFEPASVICEILNPDGSMARLPDLIEFGREHSIRIGTIADLIRYRLRVEPTVWRVAENRIFTKYGDVRAIIYEDAELRQVHLALVVGEIIPGKPTMIRVNTHRGVYDTLSDVRANQRWTVDAALERINKEGAGVVVLLEYSEDWGALDRRLRGDSEVDAGHGDLRMIGAGSQILSDLNVERVRVLGTPQRIHALSGFGLEVIDYIEAPESD
ncbi:MAG: 3,4-dihydroxy-2-butanone-4-phosphate synthase [Acidiferrobacteraceae bacterium]|nr:3,4-dihydroxy-2-butanone-4-phosphate synthase [Acidiferrobacteraceae bacterium]|tara:strand:- start:1256 stop:2359 length:1104 start_codon:yes stop_codon:yes gene_type:complete